MNPIDARSSRLGAILGRIWIYAMLAGGAAVFSWPFLWMTSTSIKVEREIFGGALNLRPETPRPALRSPYLEPRLHRELDVPRMAELLPVVETALVAAANGPPHATWAAEVHAAGAAGRAALARSILRRLHLRTPPTVWELPGEELNRRLSDLVSPDVVGEAVLEARREFGLGAVRVRSLDLDERVPVASEQAAEGWQITGPARLEKVSTENRTYARVAYDFSDGAREIRLARTLTLGFPADRLKRVQVAIRADDSWHPLTCYLEKGGVRYRAERTFDLANEEWSVVTWQEPGPDDTSNQIRKWLLLREVARGPSFESAPDRVRIELVMERASSLQAWWAKIRRNYRLALDYLPFGRYVATSLFLVLLNVAGTLFSCSLVAYAFARLQWPGREFSFALMLATMMVPAQVTMIPHFLIMRSLGWYNTLTPLWIGSFFAGAFNVFLLRQFMKGIPRDLEDAARIDGCGFWRVYWHIMLPLVKPTLAAIGVFTFMGVWNDFMGPLIYLSDQRLYPLSLGLYAFNVQAGSSVSMMMAGSLLMTLPVVVIFFFAQRYFIQGVTLTGMKG